MGRKSQCEPLAEVILAKAERPHLQPLPASLFPCFQEARRSVHRDRYVEVEKAFYEAPPELIGHEVWVRWDSKIALMRSV